MTSDIVNAAFPPVAAGPGPGSAPSRFSSFVVDGEITLVSRASGQFASFQDLSVLLGKTRKQPKEG